MRSRGDTHSNIDYSNNLASDLSSENLFFNKNHNRSIHNATMDASNIPMPKHIPFPDFQGNSELLNELLMFLFITSASAMQFINIYRTNWWIPQSYMHHSVNFYLIEPYLIILIMAMAARRLVYCIVVRIFELAVDHRRIQQGSKNQRHRIWLNILRYTFLMCLLALLSFCVFKIYARHSYKSLFLLLYPIVVYLLIFGFQLEPFLRTSCELVEGAYFNGMPMHSCSSNPAAIREEIEILRNDFNLRFRQVIFTSVVNAYYAGFVPCFFAVNYNVYYNVLWATQHVIFVWLSVLTLCTVYVFPSKYSDILHRASLHLGYWAPLEVSAGGSGLVNASAVTWQKSGIWTHGSVIKHCGELYRSQGLITVAMPNNPSHSRFYKLFQNPMVIYKILSTLQASIVLSQLTLLCFAIEWHFILSISFITLTNQFALFRIIRDYLITKRIYTSETLISERQWNTLHCN